MLVLGIDSATPVSTAAVVDSDKLISEMVFNTNKTHSERLMPMIDNMLKEVGLSIKDIEGFAVSIGPGSFTGLRIGMATIKGLAHVLQRPVAGIVTLDSIAYNAQGVPGIICPILNARKNEVYTALYDGKSMELLSEYMAISPENLLQILKKRNEEITLVGDAVPLFEDFFLENLKERINIPSYTNILPRASQVAFLGEKKLSKSKEDSLIDLKPFYIRKSEAEIRLLKKTKGDTV